MFYKFYQTRPKKVYNIIKYKKEVNKVFIPRGVLLFCMDTKKEMNYNQIFFVEIGFPTKYPFAKM